VGDRDDGHFGKPEHLSSAISTVTRKDHARLIDQNRIGPAEPLDAVSNLPKLLLGMGA
jgi:hypothetical protein